MPDEILGKENDYYRQDDFLQSQELFQEIKPGLLDGGGLNERRLLDFINNQEKKVRISQFERDQGLEQGSVQKAMQKIRDDIGREIEMEKSLALEEATNPNINPETGAELARFAGYDVKTGEQLKAAKPILKRIGKTSVDPNISVDAKQKSLQQDREEVEQILFRSTVQGGRRGVAVTGQTGAQQRAGEELGAGRFYPEEFGGVKNVPLTPASERYFPGPKQTPQRDLQRFMQTLEPETSLLRGAAGQREIAGKKQRNKLRIEQWQVRQPKQAIVPEGSRIFETRPGEATPLTEPSRGRGDLKERKLRLEEGRFKISEKELALSEKRLDQAERRLKTESKGKGLKEGTIKFYVNNIKTTLGERDQYTGNFTGKFSPEARRQGWKRFVGLASGMDRESGIKLAKSLRSLMDAPPAEILAAFPEYFPEAGEQPPGAQETPEQIRADFMKEGKTPAAREKAKKRFEAIGFTGQ